MKAQEFRGMESAAIETELDNRRRELLNTRCRVALGEEVHPHQIKTLRRDIARMKTVIREREREEEREKEIAAKEGTA